jgi:hypothetical protein
MPSDLTREDLDSPADSARRELAKLIRTVTGLPYSRACDVLEIFKQLAQTYLAAGEPVLLTSRQASRVRPVLKQVFTDTRWDTDLQFRGWVVQVFGGRIVPTFIPVGRGPEHLVKLSVLPA